MTAPSTEHTSRSADNNLDTVAARLGLAPSSELAELLSSMVVTVASWKGGVGKTEIAREVAYVLGAVLVDLDWDEGNATLSWGYNHEERLNAPLLDALEKDRIPRPLKGVRKPDLVPCHPDLAVVQPEMPEMAASIKRWSAEWKRPMVIDTHPGGGQNVTDAALFAADVVLAVVNFETRPLKALRGMLRDHADYPILIQPTKVHKPNARLEDMLIDMSEEYSFDIAPLIHLYPWLGTRQRSTVQSAANPISKRAEKFVAEIAAVAREIVINVAASRGIALTNAPGSAEA